MAKNLICFILFLNFMQVYAQQPRHIPISIAAGMGAYNQKPNTAFAMASNIASIAYYNNFGAGVLAERRFNLSELTNTYTNFFMPVKNVGTFGLQANLLGDATFNETNVQLNYARTLGSQAAIGIGFNFYNMKASGYNNASTINATISGLIHLSPKVSIGAQAAQLMPTKFGVNKNEQLASVLQMGIGYNPSDDFYCSAELIKEENYPLFVTAKFRYKPIQKLALQLGISSQNNNYNFGASFFTNNIEILVGVGYQARLGSSPTLGLSYMK